MKIKKKAQKLFNTNARFQALDILYQVEYKKQYSDVLLNRFMERSTLKEIDKNLVVHLVYGVLQRRYTLNYYLQPLLKGKKVDPWIATLLRLTVYQVIYMDRIPAHAAIHEAVEIAKLNGHQALGNFVNAILRNFLRNERPSFDAIENKIKRLAITYSLEEWIVELLLEQIGEVEVEALLASLLEAPFVAARIVAKPEEREGIMAELIAEGYEVVPSKLSSYGIRVEAGNLIHSKAFKEGKITIQDESSQMVVPLGELTGSEEVLDACAAPGGKTTHIAQLLTSGHVTALDISAKKLHKVAEHAKRLHLSDKVSCYVSDARTFAPEDGVLYDRIYLDVPCSGLGLMRRKPEIKYMKKKEDIEALIAIQKEILQHATHLLSDDGEIIYSTCTLSREENENMLEEFVKENAAFMLAPITASDHVPRDIITEEGFLRIWPQQYHTDGFFIGRLKRKQS